MITFPCLSPDIEKVGLVREAKEDYVFSNGLKIPKGSFVGTSIHSVHTSEEIYKDANEFKPWRFVDDKKDNDEISMRQYVATSAQFLAFGYGKHAWYVYLSDTFYGVIENYNSPGRFFAVNELKAMLCFVVMNYDIQLADGSKERPVNLYSGAVVIPNTSAKVMFRRRST